MIQEFGGLGSNKEQGRSSARRTRETPCPLHSWATQPCTFPPTEQIFHIAAYELDSSKKLF